MKRTTAPGASGGQYVDDNPALGVVGTLLVAADRNATQEELCAPIEGAGIVLDGGDSAQLWKAIRKAIVERSKHVGEVFPMLDRRSPVAFGAGTEDTYFPALCLTDIASYVDISATNWADLVPYLRGLKSKFKEGLSGEISSPVVTNWAITGGNLATLTFQNDTDHIAFLTALAEDQTIHGSFTNWRTITLANAIGSVSAGTYAISAIAPGSRTVSFAFTGTNGSGSVTAAAEFYAFRIAGSTTTARLWSAKGLTMHGVNDANGYFVSGGLRRQGYLQGHYHSPISTNIVVSPSLFSPSGGSGAYAGGSQDAGVGAPKTDGTNGTPRVAKETHGPALSVHLYVHGGRYAA